MALLRSHGILVANEVTTVTLASPGATPVPYVDENGNDATKDFQRAWISLVRVTNVDNVGEISFSVDGSTPVVGGQGTWGAPEGDAVTVRVGRDDLVEVKLISSSTPMYSVEVVG